MGGAGLGRTPGKPGGVARLRQEHLSLVKLPTVFEFWQQQWSVMLQDRPR